MRERWPEWRAPIVGTRATVRWSRRWGRRQRRTEEVVRRRRTGEEGSFSRPPFEEEEEHDEAMVREVTFGMKVQDRETAREVVVGKVLEKAVVMMAGRRRTVCRIRAAAFAV